MGVNIYKRWHKKTSGKFTYYFKINHRGRQWNENTHLHSGSVKPHKNENNDKLVKQIRKRREAELEINFRGLSEKKKFTIEEYFNEFVSGKTAETRRKNSNTIVKFGKVVNLKSYLDEINPGHIQQFIEYCELKHNPPYSPQTIGRDLKTIKSLFLSAFQDGLVDRNIFNKVSPYKMGKVIKPYLTFEELGRVINLDIKPLIDNLETEQQRKESKLELVKDMFVFQCLTGLRFSDITNSNAEFENHIDRYIIIMKKTKEPVIIYKTDVIDTIISKYGHHVEISLRIFNKNLKKIMTACGINKHITSSIARHTLAMLLSELKRGTREIQGVLGHTSVTTTETYARLLPGSGKDALKELYRKLELK